MKAIKFLCCITLICILFAGCSKDDYIEGADYNVDITLAGDVDEFVWFLYLDGYGEQINQDYNPFDLSQFGPISIQSGQWNANTTYSFEASLLDGMYVKFIIAEGTDTEIHNMSINIVINKNSSQIANFNRDFEISPTTTGNVVGFKLESTKESNNIEILECEGELCSDL